MFFSFSLILTFTLMPNWYVFKAETKTHSFGYSWEALYRRNRYRDIALTCPSSPIKVLGCRSWLKSHTYSTFITALWAGPGLTKTKIGFFSPRKYLWAWTEKGAYIRHNEVWWRKYFKAWWPVFFHLRKQWKAQVLLWGFIPKDSSLCAVTIPPLRRWHEAGLLVEFQTERCLIYTYSCIFSYKYICVILQVLPKRWMHKLTQFSPCHWCCKPAWRAPATNDNQGLRSPLMPAPAWPPVLSEPIKLSSLGSGSLILSASPFELEF